MKVVLDRLVEEPHVALISGSAPVVIVTFAPAIENRFVLPLVIGAAEGEGVLRPDYEGAPLPAGRSERRLQRVELR
jgi:hypothetical protein